MKNMKVCFEYLLPVIIGITLHCVTATAQNVDVSDSVWSIIVPTAAGVDLVDMGQVQVNDTKDSVVLGYLTNTGPVDIRIDSIGVAAPFKQLTTQSFVIPKGSTRQVEFLFTPPSAAVFSSPVIIYTQADTLTKLIRGEGVVAQISIPHTLVDFGQIRVNTVKDTLVTYIISNVGTGTLAISGMRMLGPDTAQFSALRGSVGFSLAPGQQDTMTLRFAPKTVGRTSGRLGFYYGGPGSPAVVDLFGEGLGVTGYATLTTDTIRAKAGELVEVPVFLRNAQDVELTGATGFYSELRFNATLLSPFGASPKGMIRNGERIIALDNLPIQPDAGGVLARIQFIAMLGNAEGTPLRVENSFALGGKIALTEVPGYFLLTDVCHEGGTRLFGASGTVGLFQNRPNPFNAMTMIEYEVIENGPTRLLVMDMYGRTVATIVDEVVKPGKYSIAFDAGALPSGTYLTVLQTPTARKFKVMEVVK
jgi:hypothetical protein